MSYINGVVVGLTVFALLVLVFVLVLVVVARADGDVEAHLVERDGGVVVLVKLERHFVLGGHAMRHVIQRNFERRLVRERARARKSEREKRIKRTDISLQVVVIVAVVVVAVVDYRRTSDYIILYIGWTICLRFYF